MWGGGCGGKPAVAVAADEAALPHRQRPHLPRGWAEPGSELAEPAEPGVKTGGAGGGSRPTRGRKKSREMVKCGGAEERETGRNGRRGDKRDKRAGHRRGEAGSKNSIRVSVGDGK